MEAMSWLQQSDKPNFCGSRDSNLKRALKFEQYIAPLGANQFYNLKKTLRT